MEPKKKHYRKKHMQRRQDHRQIPRKITPEMYQQAWLVFTKDPTVSAVKTFLKCDRGTAERLVYRGYAATGWEPYQDRLVKLNKATQEKEDYNLAQSRAEAVKLLRGYRALLSSALDRDIRALNAIRADPARLAAGELPAKIERMPHLSVVNALNSLIRLEQLLLGGADGRLEITGKNQAESEAFAKMTTGWTDDDFIKYVSTGEFPDPKETQ